MLIDGTFIQLVDKNQKPFDWSMEQWEREMKWMKEVGIKLIIIQYSAYDNRAYYPSKIIAPGAKTDQLDMMLRKAGELNLQIMMGLTLESVWWTGVQDKNYYKQDVERNKAIANELWDRYKHHDSFWGWYIPHEIDDLQAKPEPIREQISVLLRELTDSLHRLTPGKPVGIAPYFGMNMTPDAYETWWTKTLQSANIDIMMLQDGVGCHRPVMEKDLEPYYGAMKKACQKTKVDFWTDLEVFDQIHCPPVDNLPVEKWEAVPAPLERIKKQIAIEESFVSRIVCFAFTHYMSPQLGELQNKLFNEYKNWIEGR